MYSKYGPGQLWEEVSHLISGNGGEIRHKNTVVGIESEENEITAIMVRDESTGELRRIEGDYFLSTMQIKDLINAYREDVPRDVKDLAQGLIYRDFMTVGLLLNELKIKNETRLRTVNHMVPDNWIYIQERDVKIGDSRYSITGAHISVRITPKFGWVWNTSVMKGMRCGICQIRTSQTLQLMNWKK